MSGSFLSCYRNENSFLVFSLYLLATTNPVIPVIDPKDFAAFNSFGANFTLAKSYQHRAIGEISLREASIII